MVPDIDNSMTMKYRRIGPNDIMIIIIHTQRVVVLKYRRVGPNDIMIIIIHIQRDMALKYHRVGPNDIMIIIINIQRVLLIGEIHHQTDSLLYNKDHNILRIIQRQRLIEIEETHRNSTINITAIQVRQRVNGVILRLIGKEHLRRIVVERIILLLWTNILIISQHKRKLFKSQPKTTKLQNTVPKKQINKNKNNRYMNRISKINYMPLCSLHQ
ncbi:hypothetical protein niasHS_016283 [Heterodera schachtii]|uniref:Uncharacterized protein n=1 Tax=Heterodera schachtii TaxID=97005 RepID=A0ABD2IFV6_HETSC